MNSWESKFLLKLRNYGTAKNVIGEATGIAWAPENLLVVIYWDIWGTSS